MSNPFLRRRLGRLLAFSLQANISKVTYIVQIDSHHYRALSPFRTVYQRRGRASEDLRKMRAKMLSGWLRKMSVNHHAIRCHTRLLAIHPVASFFGISVRATDATQSNSLRAFILE